MCFINFLGEGINYVRTLLLHSYKNHTCVTFLSISCMIMKAFLMYARLNDVIPLF